MKERKKFDIFPNVYGDFARISGCKVPIITKKKFSELYQGKIVNKDYFILGRITNGSDDDVIGVVSLQDADGKDKKYPVKSTECKIRLFRHLKGYACVGQGDYLEVYSSRLYLFLILAIIAALCALFFLGKDPVEPNPQKPPIPIEENQGEHREDPKINHSKNIIMPGWVSFTIPKGTTHIDRGIDFFNPAGNFWYKCPECSAEVDGDCYCEECKKKYEWEDVVEDCYYMAFGLYLTENDECLYQSNLVSPGMHLQTIEISRVLEQGTYSAYVLIQPYKSDGATPCNNGKVMINLDVK